MIATSRALSGGRGGRACETAVRGHGTQETKSGQITQGRSKSAYRQPDYFRSEEAL
jgi:hypothetical protein